MLNTEYASLNYNIRNRDSENPDRAKYNYTDYKSAFMQSTIRPDAIAAYVQVILYFARVIRKVNEYGLTEGLDDVIQLAEMGGDQAHAAGNLI